MSIQKQSHNIAGAGDARELSPRMFARFSDLVYAKAGIRLGPQKEALVAARMGKRVRALGLPGYEAYYRMLVSEDPDGSELIEMLNAISTNVTHFFREPRHFELLALFLKAWREAGQKTFRIWCAAASTGEEPYSVAMTALTVLTDTRDCRILATDISTRALEVARAGRYGERHMEKVPEQFRHRFFRRDPSDPERPYAISDDVRGMVRFARLNLATPPFPMKGPLDLVFCRNVMIYFDNRVRKALLDDIWRLLKADGYLLVGHAESLSGMLSAFRSVEPSVYTK